MLIKLLQYTTVKYRGTNILGKIRSIRGKTQQLPDKGSLPAGSFNLVIPDTTDRETINLNLSSKCDDLGQARLGEDRNPQ